jgi:hypothetical protein
MVTKKLQVLPGPSDIRIFCIGGSKEFPVWRFKKISRLREQAKIFALREQAKFFPLREQAKFSL